jgi:WD40 repeat protein
VQYKAFISYSHAADGKLAPAVQAALQKFAKPWYRLRALRVFRDKTSLAATPHLWGSIEEALSRSEFFLLLASPEAAASPWIAREVEWWLTSRDTATMLIVLTGGEVIWSSELRDFDRSSSSAVPAVLFAKLPEEPLYVDLRWARNDDQLSLRNSRFRAAILDLAATLHGTPKDELDGNDVREHRRTRRIAWTAAVSLVLLTIAALVAATVAVRQRNIARSRELAASARTEMAVDPELSLMLAKAAVEQASTEQAEDALREAILKSHVRLTERAHAREVTNATFVGNDAISVSFDGQVLVWDSATGEVKQKFSGHRAAACGQRIVTAGSSGGAVWSLADGRRLATLMETSALLDDVAFSPDCHWIAAAGRDKTARVFRAETGERVGPLLVDDDILTRVGFSPDSRMLVTQRIYNRTDLWDVPTGQHILRSPGHRAAFSPDLRILVAAGADNTGIRIWQLADRRLVETIAGQPGSLESVAFSPDGSMFVTAGTDRTARVWDAKRLRPIAVLSGHTDSVVSAEFSHHGRFIVTASRDKTARVWVAHSGELVADLRGHSAAVNSAVFSADDRRVLTSSKDSTARVWSTGMANPVLELTESGVPRLSTDPGLVRLLESASNSGVVSGFRTVQQVAFSRSGELALLATDTDVTEVWRPRTGERLALVPGTIAAFSPDAQSFVTGAEDGAVRVYRTAGGELVRDLEAHEDRISGLAFSADGTMIGTAGEDHKARIFEASSGTLIARLEGHTDSVSGLWFSPDGTHVLTAGFDNTAILWQLPQGSKAADWRHDTSVQAASVSADGRLAATADSGGTAKIWEVATRRVVAELRGHEGGITDIHFNSNGDRLLTAGSDGTARIWRLHGNVAETESVLRGHSQSLSRAIWSPDGRFIATASQDYLVRLWEGSTGRALTALGTHTNAVYDIAFSPDGAYLMSGSEDGTAHIYACEVCASTGRLLALASARITRSPTPLELRNFGLDKARGADWNPFSLSWLWSGYYMGASD